MNKFTLIQLHNFTLLVLAIISFNCEAGPIKWLKNEALPTVTGERPLEIKPYVSISSGSTKIRLSDNAAMVKIGGLTVQTSKLKLRLAQAGCVISTGDIYTCAPDVINREATRLANDIVKESKVGKPKDFGRAVRIGKERVLSPSSRSQASNLVSHPSPRPPFVAPTATIDSIVIKRTSDFSGNLFVEFSGGAIFSHSRQQIGGMICFFSTGQGYFKDTNGLYRDAFGHVAVGGSTRIETDNDLSPIHIVIPWSELHLVPFFPLNSPIYAQCHLTVNNSIAVSTQWMPF